MAKSQVFLTETAAGKVSFNVVPLVDCAFLMILFFILTSQISSNDQTGRIFLSTPKDSQGKEDKTARDQVIVNVVSAEGYDKAHPREPAFDPSRSGMADHYEVNGQPIGMQEVPRLIATFKDRRDKEIQKGSKKEDFSVVIRSDWRIRYADIQPILLAAAEAGIPKIRLTVLKGE